MSTLTNRRGEILTEEEFKEEVENILWYGDPSIEWGLREIIEALRERRIKGLTFNALTSALTKLCEEQRICITYRLDSARPHTDKALSEDVDVESLPIPEIVFLAYHKVFGSCF